MAHMIASVRYELTTINAVPILHAFTRAPSVFFGAISASLYLAGSSLEIKGPLRMERSES
jgi:hypothetical protein